MMVIMIRKMMTKRTIVVGVATPVKMNGIWNLSIVSFENPRL